MKKLFLLFALVGLFATSCEMNEVPPVKQVHFELSHNNISINAGGGTASVTVFSNDYWEIEGTSDWCSPSVRSGGANEDGTTVNFVAKESYAPREATFYFLCGEMRLELKVSQEQKDVIFADENDKFSIPAKGGVALIEYQTNVECEVIIPNEAQDWISLTSTRALREESIGLDIAPNESYDPRSATIMVVAVGDNTLCAKYIINQAQTDVILAGEDNKFAVPSDGADVSIDFETNVKYKVNIPSNANSWITLVDATRGIAPRSITLRVAKNTTYEKRSAVISITKDGATKPVVEYTIEQAQNDGIVFEGDTLLAPAKGGSVALDYQANVDCEVIIPDDAKEWISIAPQTRGLEKYSVTLVIASNDSFDERTTAIKVEGETVSRDIEVKQMGIERVLSLSPSKLDLPLEATNITIDIDANIDYEVVIADDCDWVTMPEAENTIENKVILAIAENPTIYSRDTEILFKGDGKDVILPVVQRGDEGVLMLNDEYIADGQDTVLSIEFNSNFDYTVSIPSTCDWLSLPETRAVVQTHTIEFALTKNPSLDNRSVEVIFSDAKGDISKSVKITQLGSPINCVVPNDNEILYITTDGKKLNISDINMGSTTVIDHIYEDGIGRITCSSVITQIDGFDGCTTLEQIAIPDSVTTIGMMAFYYCTSLTSVTIPNNVTTIGEMAFSGCDSLTSITIPDSVTTIGGAAFYGCTSLESVTIGNSVTTIGGNAFAGCDSLKSITIPDSVTTIGVHAFDGCTSLTNVTIPDSVTTIGYYAFYDCNLLTSVTIPDSVTTIGGYAFYGCTSLESVTIGNGVTEIGWHAFDGCTGELIVNCNIDSTYTDSFFDGSKFTKVTIGDSVTKIGNYTFYNCDSLTSVTIPDSVTTIGERAFCNCNSLTSVTIGNGVTKIGDYAFYGCTGELIVNGDIPSASTSESGAFYGSNFTKVTIGDSVIKIGNYAFEDCDSLKSVTIGDSVIKIGNYAFDGCTSLTSVTIPNSVTTIGGYAFWGCDSLTSVTIPDRVTTIGERAFCSCDSLTSVTIGNGVTTIGGYAFYGCDSLTSVTIGSSITSVGEYAFQDCTGELIVNGDIPSYAFKKASFTKVTIGDDVAKIGNSAFSYCTGELIINSKIIEKDYTANNCPSSSWLCDAEFTKLTIGDGIEKIGNCAFYYCDSLTSVTIGNGVTEIGEDAFYYCYSLEAIYCKPTTPPSLAAGAFYDIYNTGRIYVPSESIDIYKRSWWNYESRIVGMDI